MPATVDDLALRQAYAECERITWSQARNFGYGIRLLPPAKRRGLAAIYAYARRIDDIGDGTLSPQQKISRLDAERHNIISLTAGAASASAIAGGGADAGTADAGTADAGAGDAGTAGAGAGDAGTAGEPDPVLIALADVKRTFPQVPLEAFGELIDGCVADVRGTSYETFEELHHYCRCVAGSIGRLSLGIFGSRDPDASAIADSLGVALQLTNILRDVREDFGNGRVYLPAEDLKKFDVTLASPDPVQFTRLMEFEVERARDWYATGLRLLSLLDRRSAACTGAMAGIYRRLLERIAANPAEVLQTRVSLPTSHKLMVAATALTSPRSIR